MCVIQGIPDLVSQTVMRSSTSKNLRNNFYTFLNAPSSRYRVFKFKK